MKRTLTTLLSLVILVTATMSFGAGITGLMGPVVAAGDTNLHTVDPAICNNPNARERPGFCDDIKDNQTATNNALVGSDGLLTKIVQAVVYIATIVSVIVIIIGGLRFAVSAGDAEKAATARQSIIYAVIGLVIAAAAQIVVTFILKRL